MSEHNYSDSYVSIFRNESVRMLDYLSGHDSLDGYFQGYTERCGLKQTPQKRSVFRLIRSYIECGRLPSRRHPLRGTMPCHEMLPEDIRGHLDSYLSSCGDRWAPPTAKKIRQTVSAFLLHFLQSGTSPDRVPEGEVWSYFYDSGEDRVLRGHNSSYNIRRFLSWAGSRPGGEHYLRILPMEPRMKQVHKLFDCLSEEEDARLVSYVLGDGCGLSLRDRAIVTVARFCGLRACDIATLRMEDVDLGRSRLSVRQRKTGRPLEQALRPVVGNAICRYVMEERPETDLPEVFLVDEHEVRPLAYCTVGEVCDRAYRLAGIRQDGRRGGSHLLRHRFAQALVESGACDSAAMRLLGHTSPSSLEVYLESDDQRLRDCALSISGFKTGKEVLA